MSIPTDETILDGITKILRDIFDDDTLVITPEFSRKDNALWDSMNHLNIVFAIEGKFHIKFSIVDIEEIQSVGDAIALIKNKLAKK